MVQLYKGDCVEVMEGFKTESIDLIVTDPPYKIITGGDSNGKNSIRPKGILSGNRELMKFIPKFSEWLPECYRVLKNGTHAYFMVNSTNLTEMLVEVEKTGFKIIDRVKFTHPVKKIGFRPLLRFFTPRYYLVYAER